MNSHHFIGAGQVTDAFEASSQEPEALLAAVEDLLATADLRVVSSHMAGFADGGPTLVWILAESHLVLHLWPEEAAATVDLHVCDFSAANESKARHAVGLLTAFCFAPGSAEWREMELAYGTSEPA